MQFVSKGSTKDFGGLKTQLLCFFITYLLYQYYNLSLSLIE